MNRATKYSSAYIIIAFVLAYLHRRADLLSSAWLIIGIFALYVPIVVFHIRYIIHKNQSILEGLLAIYAVGLFMATATFFVLGKDHLAQAGEPIAAIWILTAAFVVWRLYRRERMTLEKQNTRVLLSNAAPALMAVLSFLVLNYR